MLQPFCSQGSTLVTVAGELARSLGKLGGSSYATVSSNRSVEVASSTGIVVDYHAVCPREWFSRRELMVDVVVARLGLRRPHVGRLYRPAIDAAREADPSLILLYEGYYALQSLASWRDAFPGTPLVLYAHNPFARSYTSKELRRSLECVTAVACVSGALGDALSERVPSPPCPIEIVHNGVDSDRFRPSADRECRETFEILFVGAVRPYKGPHRLLEAVSVARKLTQRAMHVQITGSSAYDAGDSLTEYERSLRAMAAELQLDVTFSPFLPNDMLPGVYAAADVLSVPSLQEPYGLVILEAMACGLPVVASGRGGTREAGGDAAMYVDPDDSEAFGRLIARLAEDRAELEKRSVQGRHWALAHSWGSVMKRLLELGGLA